MQIIYNSNPFIAPPSWYSQNYASLLWGHNGRTKPENVKEGAGRRQQTQKDPQIQPWERLGWLPS